MMKDKTEAAEGPTGNLVGVAEHLVLHQDLQGKTDGAQRVDGRHCGDQQLDGALGCLDTRVRHYAGDHKTPLLLLLPIDHLGRRSAIFGASSINRYQQTNK